MISGLKSQYVPSANGSTHTQAGNLLVTFLSPIT